MPTNSLTPPPRHRLLTVKEFRTGLAQGGWEVASSTVYHWTEAGLVRFARVGMGRGRLRIYPDQVEVMLARHRRAELLQAIAPTSQVG